MSWWSSIKQKLPDGLRQLPSQIYGDPAATRQPRMQGTIELSTTFSSRSHLREEHDGYTFDEVDEETVEITETKSTNGQQQHRPRRVSSLQPSSSDSQNLDSSAPLMEGWLAKQTILNTLHNRTPFKNRYFILKRGCLYYYAVVAETTITLDDFMVCREESLLPVNLGTEGIGYLLTLILGKGDDSPIPSTKGTSSTSSSSSSSPATSTISSPLQSPSPALSDRRKTSSTAPSATSIAQTTEPAKLFFAFHTETERNAWLSVLTDVENGDETKEMKGWVLSREGEGRIWRPHYLTLKGTKLEYHRRDRKGYFPLTGCEVWSNDGFSFSIRAPNGKILSINTATQEIRDEWMVKLEQVIAYLEKKDTSDMHSKISGQNISYAEELLEYTNRVKDYLEHERLQVEARIRHNIEHDIKPPLQGSDGIYRIISLDGGGMRGVMNCIILDRLLKVFPDLLSRVNMFVGTSNGGMLAMAFAFGYSPAVCRSVLELSGRHVFKREGSAAGYGIKTAKFSSAPLEILCREIYGKHTLSNCFTHVLLPSLLLDNGSAVPMKRSCETRYYHNLPRKARRSGSQSVSNRKVRAVSVTVNGEERTNIVNTVRVSVGDSARYPYQSYSSTTSSVEGEERVATLSSSEEELSTNREEEKERRGEETTGLQNNSETTKEQNEKEEKGTPKENGPTEESPNKCKKANEDEEEMEEEYNPMINELASDVVLRTAAAPTYFPSFQQHVDGGMFAHDPASAALTYAISPNYLAKNLKDVRLLSFGTGKVNHYYEDENHDWGYVQWVPKLTNLLWDGMIMHSENICRELLGERYYRFNPVLETEIALDNPLAIPELVETAKKLDLSALVEWIGEQFYSPSSSSAT